MAISLVNNLSMNRSDAAVADQVWTATSATLSDFQSAGGGGLLQLKTVYKQDTFTLTGNSGTWSDVTDVTVDITPTLSTSKILVLLCTNVGNTTSPYVSMVRLMRDSTAIMGGTADSNRNMALWAGKFHNATATTENTNAIYLDAPATTSATTYKLQGMAETGSTFTLNRTGDDPDINYTGRYPTTLTVAEIAVGIL
jgi:hypothetical protein